MISDATFLQLSQESVTERQRQFLNGRSRQARHESVTFRHLQVIGAFLHHHVALLVDVAYVPPVAAFGPRHRVP